MSRPNLVRRGGIRRRSACRTSTATPSICTVASFSPASSCRALPGFEEWLEVQRTRLRDDASAAAGNLSKELEAAGGSAAAANWARRGVELAPFSEAAFRRFLTLLDRSGDRAAAVHAYAVFRRRHRTEELEMSPSAYTRLLIETIAGRASDVRELEKTRYE